LREPIAASDRRLMALAGAAVVFSGLFVWHHYTEAFPQASLDLRLSREQITSQAERFLGSRNLTPAGFRNLTLFDPDDEARLFLEREAGLERANQLMQDQVSVWRWRARWYKPPEKEERIVYLSPGGRVIGFRHIVEEKSPGAKLTPEEARTAAESFLASQTKIPHRLVEQRQEQRPARLDHIFTWEQEGFRIKDATYRRSVVVQGDGIGSYSEFLHVPEQWQRDFAALRSKNELYTQIAQAFYVPLILAGIVLLIQAARQKQIPWRPLVVITGVTAALMIANQWNSLPFFLDNMPTSSSHGESLVLGLLQGLGAGVGVFFYVILAAAPGQWLYRRFQPGHLRLTQALSFGGIQTREFFRASLAGYGFAAAHIIFLVAFYLVGKRFGVWSPQDVGYSDLLSTAMPWLYPLGISVLASVSEEFWFRLLAIPLLYKLTRSKLIAVVAPALVWGFLHANYPQQPGYIRGIEVGLIGIASGYLMLRFGILATLIWHYTVDAVLIGTFLFQSSSLYFQLSGLVVAGAVLFPLAISVVRYRSNGGFLVEEPAEEVAEPTAAAAPETIELHPPLEPMWSPRLLYFLAAFLFGLGLLLRPQVYGNFLSLKLTLQEALAKAPAPPPDHRTVAEYHPNLDAAVFEYLRRQSGPQAATRIVEQHTATGLWSIRHFQPQKKRAWIHYLHRDGEHYRTDHVLDEKATGANLSPAEARGVAENYLISRQGVKLADYRLIDSSHQKRDQRTDHMLVWEHTDFRAGEARARLSVEILGDEPSGFRRFIKLPEEWLREFRRPRLQGYFLPAIAGAAFLFVLILFVRRLSQHEFRWRSYLVPALAGMAAVAVGWMNQWPAFYSGYDTAVPIEDYVSDAVLGAVMQLLLSGFLFFLGALAADLFLGMATGRRALPPASTPLMLALAAVVFGYTRVSGWLVEKIPGDRMSLPLWNIAEVNTWHPALEVMSSAVMAALAITLAAAVVLPVGAMMAKRQKLFWILSAAAATAATNTQAPWLMLFSFVSVLALAALLELLVRSCAAALLSLAPAVLLAVSLEHGAQLARQPNASLQAEGYALMGAGLILSAVFCLRFGRSKATVSAPAPTLPSGAE